MSSTTSDSPSKGVSTIYTAGIVIGSVFGIILCTGAIVILICIIKHCNKPRNAIANGMILQPYQPYPPYPNYAPPPQNPPPYTFAEPEFSKTPGP